MRIVKQFTVCLENRPGQLASLCKALAREKANILAISVSDATDQGIVRFVADNPAAVRRALTKAKLAVGARDVLAIGLANQPGVLAQVSAKLAKAGINIQYVYGSTQEPGGEALCILAVDDTATASKVLG